MLSEELKFDYVIRFRGNIAVTAANGEMHTAASWVGPGGRACVLRGALVTAAHYQAGTVVRVQGKEAGLVSGRQQPRHHRQDLDEPLRQTLGH